MASYGQSVTIGYYAYNTTTGAYVTGDVSNHTLRLIKDGTSAAPTNSPAENDATNTPGFYTLVLTTAEAQHNVVSLAGKSSTANVIIVGISISFELLPTALDANGWVKADVEDWKGTAVSSPATGGIPDINVKNMNNVAATSITTINANLGTTQAITFDGNNLQKVDVEDWKGTAVIGSVSPDSVFIRTGTAQAGASSTITLDAGASATNNLYNNATIQIRGGTGAGQVNIISAYNGSTKVATVGVPWVTNPDNTSTFTISATGPANVSGTVGSNITQWLGTNVSAATAGIPDVNVKNMNNVAATSITTINANQGTTQPVNFTGTAGSALVKSDMIDIASSAVSTSAAQIGVNTVNIAGQAAQLDGNNLLKVDIVDIAGSAVSATAAQLGVNVVNWNNTVVATPATAGIPDINVKNYNNQTAATDANNLPKVDVDAIKADATCATNLQRSTAAIITVTTGTGSTTTNIVVSSSNPSMTAINEFQGRIVIFDKATTTTALRGQATNITANDASGNITVTALTNAPVNGDTFTIT